MKDQKSESAENVVEENRTFISRVFCSVDVEAPQHGDGMRGAVANVVCKAPSIADSVELIVRVLRSEALTVRGFEFIFDIEYSDRPPSEYEEGLIGELDQFPVQFKNVHYFPPDGVVSGK